MEMENRAKQFVPFAALKGYEEALRAKEKEVEAAMEKAHKEGGECILYNKNRLRDKGDKGII